MPRTAAEHQRLVEWIKDQPLQVLEMYGLSELMRLRLEDQGIHVIRDLDWWQPKELCSLFVACKAEAALVPECLRAFIRAVDDGTHGLRLEALARQEQERDRWLVQERARLRSIKNLPLSGDLS